MSKPTIKSLSLIIAKQRADLKKMHFTVPAYKDEIHRLGGDPNRISRTAASKRAQNVNTSKEGGE